MLDGISILSLGYILMQLLTITCTMAVGSASLGAAVEWAGTAAVELAGGTAAVERSGMAAIEWAGMAAVESA